MSDLIRTFNTQMPDMVKPDAFKTFIQRAKQIDGLR